jgi:hypothetical protein
MNFSNTHGRQFSRRNNYVIVLEKYIDTDRLVSIYTEWLTLKDLDVGIERLTSSEIFYLMEHYLKYDLDFTDALYNMAEKESQYKSYRQVAMLTKRVKYLRKVEDESTYNVVFQ